ncbi:MULTISPECIES: hypothetical protein [unclassified Polynucleobacter]|jgi:hypothetical protein|uniref:hypothetical protein n=1 Tax=unclassified Polynucleobacter TaxID=2640945 RepID=UPI000BC36F45|nr:MULTISPECIES: hypothetical protein [unclassified Polynucleobacter]OYY15898.1 MAG: hypothetical protein B7Y67_09615 [Polynucleobacter sp. 35-46-11]OZA76767.1 MAG: hypothetical protein B7X71_07245 [Polynucleobacter sp. 39-46-10]
MYAIIERPENGATAKQIIVQLSEKMSLPSDQIQGHYCDNRFPSRKPVDRYSCVELIRFIWINQSSRRAFVVKLPKDLPSDDAFIQSFDDHYLGYVPQKLGRSYLKDLAILHKKIKDIEKYKRQLGTGIFALMGTAGMSAFSKRELSSLLSEQAKSLRPVYAMIDERLEVLKGELSSKGDIFQRGSSFSYYDRLAA